ncbi:hairy-related 5 [Stegastes partitus]|uniref:Hairy-related 5 n=1 Tax=Stegastes partitus TaxID=144197 RepID=A0A9Y4JQ36_9TELE|nr:PREDICTED: transcription factor HES-7.1-like [Stegastes partitus]
MKAFSYPQGSPRRRRRVSKPMMEKRRRDRINHSLETLRLLMLESTKNEKLNNPKAEKAEILESVVEFLKTERKVKKGQKATTGVQSSEPRPTCSHQQSYHDGMRSCLLRVSQFVASKSQESGGTSGEPAKASFTLPEPQTHASTSGHKERSPAGDPAAPSSQHHQHGHSSGMLFPTVASAVFAPMTDPVWRPWP